MKYITKYIIVAILCLSPAFLYAQDIPKDLRAFVDKDEVNIGDRIKLEVTAQKTRGMDIIFPEELVDPGEFSLLSSKEIKPIFGTEGRVYVLSIYTTGTHVIHPVPVKFRTGENAEWDVMETRQIPIVVNSLLTGEDKDIKGIKGLAGFQRGISWLWWVVVAFLAAIGAIIWKVKRRGNTMKPVIIRSAQEIAYEELASLKQKDLPAKGCIREYYFILSNILRHYLENRFSLRAPEMTTEEFLKEMKTSSSIQDQYKSLLKRFLRHCDMVKFAKYGPTPLEMIDSFKTVENMVDQTKPVEEEGEEVNAPG